MALLNRPNGLSPIGTLTGASWNQQGRLYYIPSTDSTSTYAIGDVVKTAGSADANGVPAIQKLTNGDVPLGIIVGIRQADPGVSLVGATLDLANNFVPKTKARAYYVYVVDDPLILFEVQSDSTGPTQAQLHQNAALTITADQTSTLSPSSPYSSTVATAWATTNSLNLRVLGSVQRPDNVLNGTSATPYLRLICKFNFHEFGNAVATGFTGV
jgi:hypothetical protein